MNTTGGIIHDQAEADTDATISERITIGIGMLIIIECYMYN